MFLQGYVGQPTNVSMGSGTPFTLRGGQMSDLITSELQGRFYENTYRGNVYCTGTATLVAIAAATFAIGTLGATCTPIVGVWNPTTSPVNLAILQATLALTMTSVTATGPGPFFWCVATAQSALTLGTAPYSRKTLTAAGSFAKGFANGAALTNLSGSLVVMCGSALGGGSAEDVSFVATAVAMQTQMVGYCENIDGSIVVPPGGLLVLLSGVTPVAHSCSASMMWAEVPI